MIVLYPGAFKPPHRGHFNVVKSLLDGSYNGSIYDKDNYKEKGPEVLNTKIESKPNIDKVIIFVGGGERNGITKEEATSIWGVYARHLTNLEILDGQKNPMFAAKEYAQANPDEEFLAVTGLRSDKDFVDLRRITTFKNAPNVQGLALAAAPGSGVRATDFRKSILSGNLDTIIDFFPTELSREQILSILTDLKDKIVAEVLNGKLEDLFESWFVDSKELNEGSRGTPVSPKGAIRSVDRQKIADLYDYLKVIVPSDVHVNYQEDRILVSYKEPHPYDNKAVGQKLYEKEGKSELKDYITSLTEYMLDQKMNIVPLPEIKLKKDPENSANFFGKTAYYDPNIKEIVLYTEGRHMKDICRSYTHEMVHHIQNLEGRIENIQTDNTNKDDSLLEIEKEAYLVGNITFRNWEDKIKNK